jgi:hypothetical protein
MATLFGNPISAVTAGSNFGYSTNEVEVSKTGLTGTVLHSSSSFTRFSDTSGSTLDIPLSLCNLTITPSTTSNVAYIIYTIACGPGVPAYEIEVFPSTIKSIPRGSSDLVVPSTVITSTTFPVDTVSRQVFSYVPPSLASIEGEFTIEGAMYAPGPTVTPYTFTVSQTIYNPLSYPGFDVLDLKTYR